MNLDIAAMPATELPVLVHMSPLPDSRNGIADYAAEILLRLSAHYQCICVVDDPTEVSDRIRSAAYVISHEDYAALSADFAQERHLAHLGNNTDHINIITALSHVPGVAVVHDLTLHYLLERWSLASFGDQHRMVETVRLLHGVEAADLSARRYGAHVMLQSIYTEASGLPLLKGCARAVITHSHFGQVMLRAAGFEGPLRVIPHFARIPAPETAARQRSEFRNRIGIRPETLLISSLGFVTANKKIPKALEALAALPPGLPDWRYIIAGENRDPAVLQTCKRLHLEDKVIFLDYLEERDFDSILAASDLCINLRYPTSGETSGTVCRALAHGLPVIVHDHGWYGELPDAAVYKIPPVDTEDRVLRSILIRCLCDAQERQDKSSASFGYARDNLDLDRIADAYRALIEEAWALGGPAPLEPASPIPATLSFAPRAIPQVPEGSSPAEAVRYTLQAERARSAGRVLSGRIQPSATMDLCGVLSPDEPAPSMDLPSQIFLALEDNGSLAALSLPLREASRSSQSGDLLSLAVVARSPDRVLPDESLSLPGDPSRWTLTHKLRQALSQAGYRVLRESEISLVSTGLENGHCRILTVTAQLTTAASARESGFRLLP